MSTRGKIRKPQKGKSSSSAKLRHEVAPETPDSTPNQGNAKPDQQSPQVPGFGEADPLSNGADSSSQPVGAPV